MLIARWKLIAAFVILTVAFVGGLIRVEQIANQSKDTADAAEKLTEQNLVLLREVSRLSRERTFASTQLAANSCISNRRLQLWVTYRFRVASDLLGPALRASNYYLFGSASARAKVERGLQSLRDVPRVTRC